MFIVKDPSDFVLYDNDFIFNENGGAADLFETIADIHAIIEKYMVLNEIDEMDIIVVDLNLLTKTGYTVRRTIQWETME